MWLSKARTGGSLVLAPTVNAAGTVSFTPNAEVSINGSYSASNTVIIGATANFNSNDDDRSHFGRRAGRQRDGAAMAKSFS